MQLKILSTNSLLKSIAFLINYALNNIFNIENMPKIILHSFFLSCWEYAKAQEYFNFAQYKIFRKGTLYFLPRMHGCF